MPKVTSKLQLTVPKKIADQYGIRPGDELEWIPAGESIRVELMRPKAKDGMRLSPEERLELFDEGTKRLRKREQAVLNGKPGTQNPRPRVEDGRERNFTTTIEACRVASLVDTNILIYRWDPRDPRKQSIAEDLLRESVSAAALYIPHQAIDGVYVRSSQAALDGTARS